MPGVAYGVEVEGLKELQRAFRELDATLAADLKKGLVEAAEPVRLTASSLAMSRIPHETIPWSTMRIGTYVGLVYVAPKKHGTRQPQRKRPNLANLLMTRAMEPALAANENLVATRVDAALGQTLARAGF